MLTTEPGPLTDTLRRLGVIGPGAAALRAEVAGDGNMNVTLRVQTDVGSFIVKHAPPFVAKYPSIAAPEARAEVEGAFYRAVEGHPDVSRALPRLLASDPSEHLLVLEDLGASRDCMDLYAGGELEPADLDTLMGWLEALHRVPTGDLPDRLANRAMRDLNHAHVFELPFASSPPVDLDAVQPGLAARSRPVRTDPALRSAAAALGRRYLADGTTLLHGDYYPGSWLRTDRGLAVIDVEFTFVGEAAFDWGVLIGHLVLARQGGALIERAIARAPSGSLPFAGVEVLRRVLGVAQLPLGASLSQRAAMLERARDWVVAA